MSNELINTEDHTSSRADQVSEVALFPLGRVVTTPGALNHCERHNVEALSLIHRHSTGDWGDLVEDDKVANENALFGGGRLFSAYRVGDEKLYAITEWDGSATTLLLAREY